MMYLPELPFYLTVELVEADEDVVAVRVRSAVHVNKEVILPTRYSKEYINKAKSGFREEVLTAVVRHYGLKAEPLKYG